MSKWHTSKVTLDLPTGLGIDALAVMPQLCVLSRQLRSMILVPNIPLAVVTMDAGIIVHQTPDKPDLTLLGPGVLQSMRHRINLQSQARIPVLRQLEHLLVKQNHTHHGLNFHRFQAGLLE